MKQYWQRKRNDRQLRRSNGAIQPQQHNFNAITKQLVMPHGDDCKQNDILSNINDSPPNNNGHDHSFVNNVQQTCFKQGCLK